VRDDVELIAYVDRLAGDLEGLQRLLTGPFARRLRRVHLLPFYLPFDGADAGFDPIDHAVVDPRLGDWDDVARLAGEVRLTVDLIVNHVSADSAAFRSLLERSGDAAEAGRFLTFERVFPDGATADELATIHRPRPGLPFTTYPLADGTRRLIWTTFGDRQIDVDVTDPGALADLEGLLDRFAAAGVSTVRLDAIGYAVKERGTSCFMTSATFAFIDRVVAACHARGLEALAEVHAHWRTQVDLAQHVDLVYDFALPPLVLDALGTGDATTLQHWVDVRPTNTVTVLDTHDGIGVVDVGADPRDPTREGLLSDERIDALVERIHAASGGGSRAATGAAASNLDRYQVNCTYLDALGGDERAHLTARAIQLLLPGRPQIYYVGLLGGRNDLELLRRTGVGRDINRHHFASDEVEAALARPAVERLLRLVELRDTHPAFDGTFRRAGSGPSELALTWDAGDEGLRLVADLARATALITDAAGTVVWTADPDRSA